MGIPNKQIGWGTKENLLWQIAKQLEKLTYQIYNTGGGGGSVTSVGLTSSTPSITITGSPVTGSGNLNFEIATASSLAPGLLSSADWTTFNSKQGAITLTTLGTSGAATLIGNTLNIPQYSGGGGGNTIYTGDGTLAGNRQVTLGGNRLDVIGSLSTTTFASNGNIGIGTNSPAVYPNYTTLEINNSVAGGLIALSGGGSLRAQMYVDGNGLNIRSVGNQLLQLGANSIGALYIYPTTQNVSIGTSTDAGYKLAVNGTARVLTSPNTSSFTVSVGSSSSDIVLGGHGVSSDFSQLKIGNDLIFSRNGGGTATIQSNLPLAFISDTNTFVGAGNVPCTWLMVGNFSVGTPKFGISNSADSDLLFGNADATYTYKQNTLARNVLWYQSDTSTSPTKVASALMSLESTTRGFLPPRMTTTQRDAITSPATGLSIYNTTTNSVEFYNGSVWTTETLNANRQTASYTLVIADAGKLVETNVASANNLTVPANSSVPFGIGTQILLAQYGAGQTTVVADTGVTIRSSGGKLKLSAQYSGATLVKIGTNEWYLFGDITI